MAGSSFQIQVRHIQVASKKVANLLAETIREGKSGVAQVQLLMKLPKNIATVTQKMMTVTLDG